MIIRREEHVVMHPGMNYESETVLDYSLATYGHDRREYGFDIEVGGDHLPEGDSGYVDHFHCCVSLNAQEAKELYDELGQWLNEHGDS
jgi:hypothetical protein